ncbi:MAG: GxxExxY protein [Flavobacterium sp.]|nr:MAG: GxxExxY protein [Flavobacterium sp.]
MTKTEITRLSFEIIGCAIKVHKNLGPGLLESIYEKCLKYELEQAGFQTKQQITTPIKYGTLSFDCDLRVDLFVNDLIVIELKAVESVLPIHEAQLITYMKLLNSPQGLLINFNTLNITQSFKPILNTKYNFFERKNP